MKGAKIMVKDYTRVNEVLLVSKYMTELLVKDINECLRDSLDDRGMNLYYEGQLDVLKLLGLMSFDDHKLLKDRLERMRNSLIE